MLDSNDDDLKRLAIVVEKFSDRGFLFNQRILYLDENEVRYYSKVGLILTRKIPKGFTKNDFEKLKPPPPPKVGIPIQTIEIQYPPEKWLINKNKKYALKLIHPKSCQIYYKMSSGPFGGYNRFNQKGESMFPQELADVTRRKIN